MSRILSPSARALKAGGPRLCREADVDDAGLLLSRGGAAAAELWADFWRFAPPVEAAGPPFSSRSFRRFRSSAR